VYLNKASTYLLTCFALPQARIRGYLCWRKDSKGCAMAAPRGGAGSAGTQRELSALQTLLRGLPAAVLRNGPGRLGAVKRR
jgi:hypothetical protein